MRYAVHASTLAISSASLTTAVISIADRWPYPVSDSLITLTLAALGALAWHTTASRTTARVSAIRADIAHLADRIDQYGAEQHTDGILAGINHRADSCGGGRRPDLRSVR
jgi:hypothetical protein